LHLIIISFSSYRAAVPLKYNSDMPKFSHLHTHSHYSLLQALPKIPDLVARAKRHEMPALALTDSGNLYGAIEFYKECKSKGIKPIIGVDFYKAVRTRNDKQAGVDNSRHRLVLLAENLTGYKNLMMLVTKSHIEGFYYKPRLDNELLENLHDGLIAIIPALGGEISKALRRRDTEGAEKILKWHLDTFGVQNVFIEITKHPELPGHDTFMATIAEFAKQKSVPVLAAHDIYYLDPEDKPARDTVLMVQQSNDRFDESVTDEEENFSFLSPEEMEKRFSDLPEALDNTAHVADRCSLELKLGKWVFPHVDIPRDSTFNKELEKMVRDGLKQRKIKQTEEIKKRIAYELSIIETKGFAPYFLAVGDLLQHARAQGILTNTRGSAAGSLVSFLCGITNINPIEYRLPFERFLNPDRPLPPDMDIDIADNRRDEVIEYARKKYGEDRVAQIGTFGTMLARGVVRDVARALGYPYGKGDEIAKIIPFGSQGFPMTIERAFEIVPELKEKYEKDRDIKRIIDMARKIEGCARHISVHAAGVVISPTPITDHTPLQYDTRGEGKLITQYDMYSIEDAGLLKFDFLGLRNLSILADTADRIRAIEGKKIDPENIPLDDKKTFVMLARGETEGTFQLNGSGMTRFLIDLRPTSIHDINAMVALYRPGPMQFIPDFIRRKHEPRLVKYLDPSLKSILERTYGILVYQDDLLMIAKDIAGYSWGEVDKFRKAVGKKIPAEMAAQKEKFIEGCVTHSKWPLKKAQELWTWIEPFAAYGFNKAHSASYGRLAYQTAYFKANFPAIYMSACLTAESGNIDTIALYIQECGRMGIPVLPPSVNESFAGFTVVRDPKNKKPDEIRFGLTTIKNFGEGIAQTIVHERKRAGRFASLSDFLSRITDKNLNKKSLESLIKAGALDEFGERGQFLANSEALLDFHKEKMRAGDSHDSLFGTLTGHDEISLKNAPPATTDEKLAWEKELLGLYISGHPLDKYKDKLDKRDMNIKKAKLEAGSETQIAIAGIVESVREILTKRNEQMAFVKMADLSGEIEMVVFPRVFTEYKSFLENDKCVIVLGRVTERNGEKSLIAEKIKAL